MAQCITTYRFIKYGCRIHLFKYIDGVVDQQLLDVPLIDFTQLLDHKGDNVFVIFNDTKYSLIYSLITEFYSRDESTDILTPLTFSGEADFLSYLEKERIDCVANNGSTPPSVTLETKDVEILCNPETQEPVLAVIEPDESPIAVTYYNLDGSAYTGDEPVVCSSSSPSSQFGVSSQIFCDSNSVSFIRTTIVNLGLGVVVSVLDFLLDSVTPYIPVGDVGICGSDSNNVTPTDISTSLMGTTSDGLNQLSVQNIGNSSGLWNGVPLPANVGITYTAYFDPSTNTYNRIGSIPYSAVGTVFLISETP